MTVLSVGNKIRHSFCNLCNYVNTSEMIMPEKSLRHFQRFLTTREDLVTNIETLIKLDCLLNMIRKLKKPKYILFVYWKRTQK